MLKRIQLRRLGAKSAGLLLPVGLARTNLRSILRKQLESTSTGCVSVGVSVLLTFAQYNHSLSTTIGVAAPLRIPISSFDFWWL